LLASTTLPDNRDVHVYLSLRITESLWHLIQPAHPAFFEDGTVRRGNGIGGSVNATSV
jgi:hypothetical protein